MSDLKPINLDNGVIQIHPLRESDIMDMDRFVNDIFEILSDDENTEYIPEKRVTTPKQIENQTMGVTILYQQKLSYMHFLTFKKLNKTIGAINILTPKSTEQTYQIKDTWFIEYYLHKGFWGHNIMSPIISAVINNLKEQKAKQVGALCFQENIASIKALEKNGFRKINLADRGLYPKQAPKYTQAYYELIL